MMAFMHVCECVCTVRRANAKHLGQYWSPNNISVYFPSLCLYTSDKGATHRL